MAKFVTEDGKDGISGDKFMEQLKRDTSIVQDTYFPHVVNSHADISKLKIPNGRINSERLKSINMYDLLVHLQQSLSLNNKCIIEMITNEDHRCINMNESIQKRIQLFAKSFINDAFKSANPKQQIRIKLNDDEFTCREETDEEWISRLCHIYMHKYHSSKLQMIKCEECLQYWLNSDNL